MEDRKKNNILGIIILFTMMIGAIISVLSCDNVNVTDAYINITNIDVETEPGGPFPSDTNIIVRAKDFKSEETLTGAIVTLTTPTGQIIKSKTDDKGYAFFNFKNGIEEGDYSITMSHILNDVDFFQNVNIRLTKEYNPVLNIYLIQGKL